MFDLRGCTLGLLVAIGSTSALAGKTDVVAAVADAERGGTFGFEVTLLHADSGWQHYADNWEVLTPEGGLLGRRTLYHPHVNEQPFTRSLNGVRIPPGITHVRIRAHDSVHGHGGRELEIELPGR